MVILQAASGCACLRQAAKADLPSKTVAEIKVTAINYFVRTVLQLDQGGTVTLFVMRDRCDRHLLEGMLIANDLPVSLDRKFVYDAEGMSILADTKETIGLIDITKIILLDGTVAAFSLDVYWAPEIIESHDFKVKQIDGSWRVVKHSLTDVS